MESFGEEEGRVEDVEKAEVMAHQGNSERSQAADFRQLANETHDYRETKLSNPSFLQNPKEGEVDRGQFAALSKQREESQKYSAEVLDHFADRGEKLAGKAYDEAKEQAEKQEGLL